METVQEILIILVTAIAPILAAMLVAALTKWMQKMGIDIEAKNRDALQSALANAAMVAVKGGSTRQGVEYVKSSVPDAVKSFGLDDAQIKDLITPHIVHANLTTAVTGRATPGAP